MQIKVLSRNMVKSAGNDQNFPIVIILNDKYTAGQQLRIEKQLCSLAAKALERLVFVFYLGSLLNPDQDNELQLLELRYGNIKMVDLSDYTYTRNLRHCSFNVFVGMQTKNMHEKNILDYFRDLSFSTPEQYRLRLSCELEVLKVFVFKNFEEILTGFHKTTKDEASNFKNMVYLDRLPEVDEPFQMPYMSYGQYNLPCAGDCGMKMHIMNSFIIRRIEDSWHLKSQYKYMNKALQKGRKQMAVRGEVKRRIEKLRRELTEEITSSEYTVAPHNTPVFSFWIVKQDLREKKYENLHPLPNTKRHPYRDNFINCAKHNKDRLVVLCFNCAGLTEKHKEMLKSLEKESSNIRVVDLGTISFGKYDLPIRVGNEEMKLSQYLKNMYDIPKEKAIPFAHLIDFTRLVIGLNGAKLIEHIANEQEIPAEKSAAIFDFDILPQEEITVILLHNSNIALLGMPDKYQCEQLENGALIVCEPDNIVLFSLYKFFQDFYQKESHSVEISKMNKDMIYCSQVLALLKYFNAKKKLEGNKDSDNVEQNFVERIVKHLIKRESDLSSSYYGHRFPYLKGFGDMINSEIFFFKYNGDNRIKHEGEYNSASNWSENLYDTELREKGESTKEQPDSNLNEYFSIRVSDNYGEERHINRGIF